MQVKYFLIFSICFATVSVNAQTVLKGTVAESGSEAKLNNVFIRDNNTKQLAITESDGSFSIKTEKGHIIIFDSPGYVSDTLYLIDMTSKKVLLQAKTISLREVSITASKQGQAFDPRKEYPEVYEKSKVYVLSPTTWFGKENRDARKLKHYFKTEAQEREIDDAFSRSYVGSIVPLKGQELDDFMTMYRPSYSFVQSNNSESMAAYINDSYKKYEALPPDKRSLPKLTTGN